MFYLLNLGIFLFFFLCEYAGLIDGAAVCVLMSAEEARNRSLQPLCRIVSWAQAGVDPAIMGMEPVDATRKAVSCSEICCHMVFLWRNFI